MDVFFPIDGGGSALQSPAADSESGGDEEGTAPGTNPRIDSIKFDFEIRFKNRFIRFWNSILKFDFNSTGFVTQRFSTAKAEYKLATEVRFSTEIDKIFDDLQMKSGDF